MDLDSLKKCVSDVVGDRHPKEKSDEWHFQCPFCHHHKKKLGVHKNPENEKFGWYHCWVCDEGGKSFRTLFKKLDASKKQQKRLSELLGHSTRSRNRGKIRLDFDSDKKKESRPQVVDLPRSFEPLWEASGFVAERALETIKRRGVTETSIVRYDIGVCTSGSFKNRIVIPSFNNDGLVNYFVARRLWEGMFLKYKNPPASRSSIIPYGSTVSFRFPVVVVEGIFDAIAVRRNALPLLGNRLNDPTKKALLSAPEVCIALDADMRETAIRMGQYLKREGVPTTVAKLPEGEDPSSLGFARVWEHIDAAQPVQTFDLLHHQLSPSLSHSFS